MAILNLFFVLCSLEDEDSHSMSDSSSDSSILRPYSDDEEENDNHVVTGTIIMIGDFSLLNTFKISCMKF